MNCWSVGTLSTTALTPESLLTSKFLIYPFCATFDVSDPFASGGGNKLETMGLGPICACSRLVLSSSHRLSGSHRMSMLVVASSNMGYQIQSLNESQIDKLSSRGGCSPRASLEQ